MNLKSRRIKKIKNLYLYKILTRYNDKLHCYYSGLPSIYSYVNKK